MILMVSLALQKTPSPRTVKCAHSATPSERATIRSHLRTSDIDQNACSSIVDDGIVVWEVEKETES